MADREVEALIRERLAVAFPGEGIIGEEGGDDRSDPSNTSVVWVVDPIDGTQCFLAGIPSWCVSIGMVVDTSVALGVVHDPVVGECFAGGRDLGAFCNGRAVTASAASSFAEGMLEVGYSFRRPPETTLALLARLLRENGIYHRSGSGALSLAYVAAGPLHRLFRGPHECLGQLCRCRPDRRRGWLV